MSKIIRRPAVYVFAVIQAVVLTWLINTCEAQKPQTWPNLPDPRLNMFVHDVGHGVTSVAVAEGLGLVTDWPDWTRYLIATVALPLAQETWDHYYYDGRPGDDGDNLWQDLTDEDSLHDIATYQSAWIVPLWRRKWYYGVAAGVVTIGFSYLWAYEWGPTARQ